MITETHTPEVREVKGQQTKMNKTNPRDLPIGIPGPLLPSSQICTSMDFLQGMISRHLAITHMSAPQEDPPSLLKQNLVGMVAQSTSQKLGGGAGGSRLGYRAENLYQIKKKTRPLRLETDPVVEHLTKAQSPGMNPIL